ncbi:MAG: aspartate aminotransferase family protein [bacterium]
MSIQEIEQQYVVPLYAKRDVALVRGEGCWVFDETGKKYLDFMSNYGPNILGHGHKAFTETVQKQLGTLINCHQSFYNDQRAAMLEAYASVLPKNLNRFFFSNSGTETVEAALKFARAVTGRTQVISTNRAYHGRTLGALAATGVDKYKDPYVPMLEGFVHISYDNIEEMESTISEKTAAVILEPIQGEGGIRIPEKNYLKQVKALCEKHGALLILDEVQTGFRTGTIFGFEHFDVVPDILCLSKAIANGLPMGVTIVSPEVSEKIPKGTHGNTFGGNPLSCAAAAFVINYFKEHKLAEHVAEVGEYFLQQLQALESPVIREVRGKGLMIGLELKDRVTKYLKKMQDAGIIALPAGSTIIRFLPPLVITKEEINWGIARVKDALG